MHKVKILDKQDVQIIVRSEIEACLADKGLAKTVIGERTGSRWSRTDDCVLQAAFEHMINDMARAHGRSYHAIACRIEKLKVEQNWDPYYSPRFVKFRNEDCCKQ